MKAFFILVYPAHPTEEQQEQWGNAVRAMNFKSGWYIDAFEDVDDNGNVHQIVVINDTPSQCAQVRALSFHRAFKAFAPFVKVSKPVFAEKINRKIRLMLYRKI